MNLVKSLAMRLPKDLFIDLEHLQAASQSFKDAYQRCEVHAQQFNEEMERAVEANDHEFEPLNRHIEIGQELADELEAKKVDLINAAQQCASTYLRLSSSVENRHNIIT